MHNLSNEYYQGEFETGFSNEYANELSPEFEFNNETGNQFEVSEEFQSEYPQFEIYQNELTQELMEVTNEAEFGAWLKRTLKKGAGIASNFLNSSVGQKATAALGNIAKKTLPGLGSGAGAWLGGKIGGLVGQADYGRQLGGKVGSRAGQYAADRYPDFLKFATDAVGNLAKEFEAGNIPAIKPAIVKAASKHYPIILKVKGTLSAQPVRGGMSNEFNNEFNNELSNEWLGETSYEGEISNEGSFNEVMEMELASELLTVQSETELDQFIGKLFKKAVGAVSNFARSSTGRALGGMIKGIAKKALPIAGSALGTFIAPGIGTKIGGALGSAASNLFELELEGLSPEDREFEVARAVVRFAGNAARRASRMGNQPPQKSARTAIIHSARRYAPGLIIRDHRSDDADTDTDDESGRWYRKGRRIIIEGV